MECLWAKWQMVSALSTALVDEIVRCAESDTLAPAGIDAHRRAASELLFGAMDEIQGFVAEYGERPEIRALGERLRDDFELLVAVSIRELV